MGRRKKFLPAPNDRQLQEMYHMMQAAEDEDAPDGAWQSILEDTAGQYARDHGLQVDPFDAFMDYIEWKSGRG